LVYYTILIFTLAQYFNLQFFKFLSSLFINIDQSGNIIYDDIMDDEHKSSSDKRSSMITHINYMLKHNAEVECSVLPDCTIDHVGANLTIPMPESFAHITYEHVTSFKFIGKVVTYFASHAYKFCKEKSGLLSYLSATGYLSAFKTHFVLKYKERSEIKPFADKMWTRYRSKLRRLKIAQALAAKKLLSEPKKAAEDDDRWTMFGIGLWGNTKQGARLIALMSILFQVGGRVSEGSTVHKEDLRTKVSNDFQFT